MQYVYGKVLKCRKQNFCPFPKIMKNYLFTDQKWNMNFFNILVIFILLSLLRSFVLYIRKWRKMPFPTFQDLSIDILHLKIRQVSRILKKMHLSLEKCIFSFLQLRLEKFDLKWSNVCVNSIFNDNLTFKTNIFQRYSL